MLDGDAPVYPIGPRTYVSVMGAVDVSGLWVRDLIEQIKLLIMIIALLLICLDIVVSDVRLTVSATSKVRELVLALLLLLLRWVCTGPWLPPRRRRVFLMAWLAHSDGVGPSWSRGCAGILITLVAAASLRIAAVISKVVEPI